MGVPKFYRWISERYPCLSEVVKEYQVPEFDNLYLDMNGIIHTCSHPNDDDPHFRITEEQIFQDIFRYIEVLFRIIRPQKAFFMAVDGVAPRAKMNQQRGRRFRSAKEAEASIQEALRKGETLPTEKRFDSNCITPGTHFMERLQTQLEYFVKTKVTHDRSWQGVKVYLSGHQTPGEGEHKIMEFIRHERSQPEYDPNTRHCLYGLDADLIMLGLCSHDPHFSLLREEVKFTRSKKNARTARAEETTFHLLHISLLREYIGHEFQQLKDTLPFPFDLESVIDDWVLMGFLVGNDFIPHLPDLHIAQNALPFIYQTYIKVMPQLGGYLNEKGTINLPRFQAFLEAISTYDIEHFEELYSDYKWLESKSQLNKVAREQAAAANPKAHLQEQEAQAKSIQIVKDLAVQQGLMTPSEGSRTPDDYDSDEDTFHQEFRLHKKSYYETKFKIKASREAIARIAYEYILGLQWICHYYYNGVQSWSWYYPYHYSPYMSDLKEVPGMKLKLKLSKPFLPFQQLLAVLPAASKECVPEHYWRLMEEEHSPIGDFYPTKFSTDLNGKQQDWEAVVLIPFIDESRLLEAMLPCTQQLNASEKRRNLPGPCLLYEHDPNQPYHAKSSLQNVFPDIEACTARLTTIAQQKWIKKDFRQYVKGLLPGCRLSVYYQGFPTLYHLHHRAYLKKAGVKVFQGMSRGENMILAIEKPRPNTDEKSYSLYEENVEVVADKLLGNSVFVNWPHMEEAKVVAVCDGKVKFTLREQVSGSRGSKHKLARKELNRKEEEEFSGDVHDIHEKCLYQRGIEVGKSRTLVYTQLLQGRKYVCGKRGEITLEKQWSGTTTPFCLQSIIKDISVKDPTFKKLQSITELYPEGGEVFNLGVPNYGCYGKIVQAREGQAVVRFTVPAEPDLSNVANQLKQSSTYQPGWRVAASVGISSFLLSRITGSIYIFYPATRKWNVGLNLRFSKDGAGIAGFTKKADQTWLYSDNVTAVLNDYLAKYPEVFTYLERSLQSSRENQLNAEDMFGSDVVIKLQELAKWLKSQPCYDGQRVYESSDVVEPSIIKAVDAAVQTFKERKVATEEIEVGVRPQFLHRPLTQQGTLVPDKNAQHHLLDRVVNVRDGYTVPLGNRGTVVGIHSESKKNKDTMLDVLFDHEFLGGLTLGGRCPNGRGYKMPVCAVVNLSYGERLLNKGTKPVAVVHPHHQTGNPHKSHHTSPGPNLGQGRLVQSQHSAFRPASKQQHQHQQKPVQLLRRGGNVHSPQKQEQSQVKTVPDSGSSFEQMWNSLMLSNRTPPAGNTPEKNLSKTRDSKHKPKQAAKQNDASSPKASYSLSAAAQSLPDVAVFPVGGQNNSQPSNKSKTQPNNNPTTAEVPRHSGLSSNNSNNSLSSKHQPSSTEEQRLAAKLLKESLNMGEVKVHSSQPKSDTLPEDRASLEKLLNNLQLTNVGIPPPVLPPAFVPQTGPIPFERLIASGRPPLASGRLPVATARLPAASVPPLMTPENFVIRPSTPQQGIPHRFYSQQSQDFAKQQQHTPALTQSQDRKAFLKEGTEKLCEILSVSSQDEKLKDETTESRTTWSAVSDDLQTQRESDRTVHESNISTHESKSDDTKKDLSDDEDVVRSTSVEDGRSAVQHEANNQSRVEQLLSWCRIRNLYSPIYTYTDSTQEKGKYQAAVTLWNGARFQGPVVASKEQATEEAAALALNLLNNLPNATPAQAPGFRGFPPPGYPMPPGHVMFPPQQFYRTEAPGNPLYQQPYLHGFVPGMFPPGQQPPAPQHHPGGYLPPSQVIPLPVNYMSMGGEPPVILPGYPYPPQTHTHPFVLNPGMYHPTAGLRMPVSIATTVHHQPQPQPTASANPQRSMYLVADNTFIPSQVMKMQLSQGNSPVPPSPPKPAPQYVLSDSPSPNLEEPSGVKVQLTSSSAAPSSGYQNPKQKSERNSRHRISDGRKQKPKLAISFAGVSK